MNTVNAVATGVGTLFADAAGGGTVFAAVGTFALSSGVLAIFYGRLFNSVDFHL